MPRQRVALTGRQLAALGLLVGLICAQGVVQLADGPFWLAAVFALLTALALVLCALVVLVPLVRARGAGQRPMSLDVDSA